MDRPPPPWDELDRIRNLGALGLVAQLLGMGGLVVSLGLAFYWTVPVAVALIYLGLWRLHRIQRWPCPHCAKPFALGYSPVGWDVWRLFTARTCQACGHPRP